MATPKVLTATAMITCQCGGVIEAGSLLHDDTFPLSTGICNCSICRYTSGALCASGVKLKGPPSSSALQACQKYSATEWCDRYFCKKCGTRLFFHHPQREVWFAFAGAIDRGDEHQNNVDTFSFGWAIHVDSASDHGLMKRLQEINSPALREMKCFRTGFDDPPINLSSIDKGPQQTKTSQISGSCHCGGMKFTLLSPSHCKPGADLKWFERMTRNDDGNRTWIGKLCLCRTCRMSQGTPLAVWAYIFPDCIVDSKGDTIRFGHGIDYSKLPDFKTAASYHSSETGKRTFCKVCGATVWYEWSDRQHIINVSPGLLQSNEALCEQFLTWDWQWVSGTSENSNKEILDAITSGDIVMK